MQANPDTVPNWIPIVLTIVGLIVTVGVPVVSYVVHSLHKRIDVLDLKIDGVKEDADERRKETRDYLMELVETKFDSIKGFLKDLKDELKEIRHPKD